MSRGSRSMDDARSAILRRRAAFLASALAAVGCGGPREPTVPAPVMAPGDAPPAGTETAKPDPPPDTPPKTKGPDYTMPPNMTSDIARERFKGLFEWTKSTLGTMDKIEQSLPVACNLTDSACTTS